MQTRRLIAVLLVAAIGLPALPAQAGERRIRCESGRNGRYRECRVDTDGRVEIVREFSYRRCQQWRTWGYDRRSVWVDNGCRAEFRVGRNEGGIGAGGAAVIGIIAGAAIMAAILAGRNRERGPDAVTAPEWAQGRFRGFNPKEDVSFEIDIARDGTVTGTANGSAVTGYVASGNRLVLGNAEFTVAPESWGFSAVHRDDNQNVIYFRIQR
jgi:hypothetical protein